MSLRRRTKNPKASEGYFGDDPLEFENDPKKVSILRMVFVLAIAAIVLVS